MVPLAGLFSNQRLDTHVSFDLHGFRRQEARKAVTSFFERAKEEGYASMTIITGRGNHANSNGSRGVLFNSLPKWLKHPEIKAAIQEVRQDMGAYEIVLKNDQKDERLSSLEKAAKVADSFFFPPEQIAHIRKKAEAGSPNHQYLLGALMINGTVIEKDQEEGAKLVRKAAEGGDHYAQMQMGLLCSLGKGVPQSYQEALKWHEKASEKDAEPYSLFVLGEYYWVGRGVVKNDKRALAYMKRAADLQEPNAAHNLGKILLEGNTETPPDGVQAHKYLNQAAQSGIFESKMLLAKQYFFGWRGIPCDYAMAHRWFLEAAKEADPVAEYYLGRIYNEGRGVSKDASKAIRWFQMSAEHGDRDAKHLLATAQIEGHGVPKNIKDGWRILKALADEGHVQSLASMGCYLLEGLDKEIPKNDKKALRCLRHAAEEGYLEAQKILSNLFFSRDPDLANAEEGEAWLRKAAAQEDGESLFRLAIFLETSTKKTKKSVQAKQREIVDCYRRAVAQEYPEALFFFGMMQLHGEMVLKEEAQGVELLKKAAQMGHVEARFEWGKWLLRSKRESDHQEAVVHFRAIADQHPQAQVGLAYCYQDGLGVSKNSAEAEKRFAQAAQQGDAFANNEMGIICYNRGQLHKSLDFFLVAAKGGEGVAQLMIARAYIEGRRGEASIEEIKGWLASLVDKKNPEAAILMKLIAAPPPGNKQKTEKGLSADIIPLLIKKAEAGNESAQLALVDLSYEHPEVLQGAWLEKASYSSNRIILFTVAMFHYSQENNSKAKELYLKIVAEPAVEPSQIEIQAEAYDCLSNLTQGAEKENYQRRALALYRKNSEQAESQYHIGRLIHLLKGDLQEARQNLERASRQGHEEATYELGVLLMTLAEKDRSLMDQAFPCFLKCAQKGHINALFQVGYSYQAGEGVVQDFSLSIKYYREASHLGHRGAQVNLATLLLTDSENSHSLEVFQLLQAAALQKFSPALILLGKGHLEGWFGNNSSEEAGLTCLQAAAHSGEQEAQTLLDAYQQRSAPVVHATLLEPAVSDRAAGSSDNAKSEAEGEYCVIS